MWQLCDGQRSAADIIEVVQQAYPDQAEQISGDVAGVVDDLHERKVLELVS